jgi:hypothetical protein
MTITEQYKVWLDDRWELDEGRLKDAATKALGSALIGATALSVAGNATKVVHAQHQQQIEKTHKDFLDKHLSHAMKMHLAQNKTPADVMDYLSSKEHPLNHMTDKRKTAANFIRLHSGKVKDDRGNREQGTFMRNTAPPKLRMKQTKDGKFVPHIHFGDKRGSGDSLQRGPSDDNYPANPEKDV